MLLGLCTNSLLKSYAIISVRFRNRIILSLCPSYLLSFLLPIFQHHLLLYSLCFQQFFYPSWPPVGAQFGFALCWLSQGYTVVTDLYDCTKDSAIGDYLVAFSQAVNHTQMLFLLFLLRADDQEPENSKD